MGRCRARGPGVPLFGVQSGQRYPHPAPRQQHWSVCSRKPRSGHVLGTCASLSDRPGPGPGDKALTAAPQPSSFAGVEAEAVRESLTLLARPLPSPTPGQILTNKTKQTTFPLRCTPLPNTFPPFYSVFKVEDLEVISSIHEVATRIGPVLWPPSIIQRGGVL